MNGPNNNSTDDSSHRLSPKQKADQNIESVVNELRSVLADMGRSTPAPSPTEQNPSAEPTFSREDPMPAEGLEENNDPQFMNGNVLGWPPRSTLEPPPPMPPVMPPSLMSEPSPDEPSFANSQFAVFQPSAPPLLPPMQEINEMEEVGAEEPSSLPAEVPVAKDYVSPPEPDGMIFPLGTSYAKSFLQEGIPPPPISPLERHEGMALFSVQLPVERPEDVSERLVESRDPVQEADAPVIPKSEGVIQIACVFPQGDEKKGQNFVSRLKVAGLKMDQPVEMQMVFTHSWADGTVALDLWKKLARQSGADILFILAPRSAREEFLSLTKNAIQEKMKCRVVYVEQLELMALYADILAELGRTRNGHA